MTDVDYTLRPYMNDNSLQSRFWANVNKAAPNGCWEWSGTKERGYGRFDIKGKHFKTHRISWELTKGIILNGLCVLHHCDNPSCVNPEHLFLGTKGDNNRDRARKGRSGKFHHPDRIRRGEKTPSAKLLERDVQEIRRLYAQGARQTALAHQWGICQATISQVVRRVTWLHVQ